MTPGRYLLELALFTAAMAAIFGAVYVGAVMTGILP